MTVIDLSADEAAEVERAVRAEETNHLEAQRRGMCLARFDAANARDRALEAVQRERRLTAQRARESAERAQRAAELRGVYERAVAELERCAAKLRRDTEFQRLGAQVHVASSGPAASEWSRLVQCGERPSFGFPAGAVLPDDRAEAYPVLVLLRPIAADGVTGFNVSVEVRLPDPRQAHLVNVVGTSRRWGGRSEERNGELTEALSRCGLSSPRAGVVQDARATVRKGTAHNGEPVVGVVGFVFVLDQWSVYVPPEG